MSGNKGFGNKGLILSADILIKRFVDAAVFLNNRVKFFNCHLGSIQSQAKLFSEPRSINNENYQQDHGHKKNTLILLTLYHKQ
jgi:hypothetical protein